MGILLLRKGLREYDTIKFVEPGEVKDILATEGLGEIAISAELNYALSQECPEWLEWPIASGTNLVVHLAAPPEPAEL